MYNLIIIDNPTFMDAFICSFLTTPNILFYIGLNVTTFPIKLVLSIKYRLIPSAIRTVFSSYRKVKKIFYSCIYHHFASSAKMTSRNATGVEGSKAVFL